LPRRIGVYGGTFDPIHRGHLRVAQAILKPFGLERVLLVPAFVPPHKRQSVLSDAYHRYAMVVLATADHPELMASTIELESPSRPYTIETLGRLKREYPNAELFFVMGSDSFADVTTWREHDRLLADHFIIVAIRPGQSNVAELAAHLGSGLKSRVVDLRGQAQPSEETLNTPHIFLTDYVCEDVSATRIRQLCAKGCEVDDLVPEAVAKYVAKYGLYSERKHERNSTA
jgi:nicotinate-nucleotide adenylyltransferase